MRPGQAPRHFELRRLDAGPVAGAFVENYWSVRWDLTGRPAYRQEVIPHPCVNTVIESGYPGEVRHGHAMPAALVHGLVTRRFYIDLIETGRVLGARFRPGGFTALTGRDASELRDQVRPLSQVFGSAADAFAADVLAEEDDERRVKLTEDFLTGRAPAVSPGYELLLAVVADMLTDSSLVRVEQVTRAHGVSARTLQRLFRHFVGASPKWVLSRYRLHDAAERLERDSGVPVATVAAAAGYFDQAHFNHEFKALLGITPAQYAAQCAASG